MSRRTSCLLAASAALIVYGLGYLVAWSFVWQVTADSRDGMEGILVIAMTMPWSMLARPGSMAVIHVGAVINALALSAFLAWVAGRRWSIRSAWTR